jgi:hypothetical protein
MRWTGPIRWTGRWRPARTGGQRRADALVQLASVWLAGSPGEGRPRAGARVVLDADTLAGCPPVDLTRVRCELERVGPVARDTALRVACDAAIGRVIMAGRSEVLDLGLSTRLVSPALRRALVFRDGGCVFPGVIGRPSGPTRITWCTGRRVV